MDCQACSEEIPDDSIFCPECGARQDLSKAGGRSFGVVSPEAVRAANEGGDTGTPETQAMDVDTLNRLAHQMATGQQPSAPTSAPAADVSEAFSKSMSSNNDLVDRVNEVERQQKDSARNEWLEMNQATAADVLSSVNTELPSHLRKEGDKSGGAAQFLEEALGNVSDPKDGPSLGLLRRMSEVAVRRVARKRGVAVESPQVALEGDMVRVNVTYVDDGRVLDSPGDLTTAFEHAVSTEVALKGLELSVAVSLFASKEGEVSHVHGDAPEEETPEQSDEETFACEACGHYPIYESDSSCSSCGAMFEDDGDDEPVPARGGPGGPPRGPSRSSPPRGPSRGGPPRGGGPGGPSRGGPPRGGGPGGPSRGGPPRGGGPGGPSRGGPPRGGDPGGPPRGGGPGGPPRGGGPPKRGGPPGGPKKRGPPR